MNLQDKIDYNITLDTVRFVLKPLRSEDTKKLLALCSRDGFTYPYIHSHKKTMHLPLEQRVAAYTGLGDQAADGDFGRSMIQAIYDKDEKELLGVACLFAISKEDTLFYRADAQTEWEIGAFVDKVHWKDKTATESLNALIQYGIDNWNLKGIRASMEPGRKGSVAIVKRLGLELIEYIPAGSLMVDGQERVPYYTNDQKPAARYTYASPPGWKFAPA